MKKRLGTRRTPMTDDLLTPQSDAIQCRKDAEENIFRYVVSARAHVGLLKILEGLSPLNLAERGLTEAEKTAVTRLYRSMVGYPHSTLHDRRSPQPPGRGRHRRCARSPAPALDRRAAQPARR